MTTHHPRPNLVEEQSKLTVDNALHNAPPETPASTATRDIAREIERGVARLLHAHNVMSVCEMPLPDGHRADIVGLGPDGRIVIIEIKSGVADFRSDTKWEAYRAYCDGLYFAVAPDFPTAILPPDTGLILADRFGGDFASLAPSHPLAAARRKAMTLRIARTAAQRLVALRDPDNA